MTLINEEPIQSTDLQQRITCITPEKDERMATSILRAALNSGRTLQSLNIVATQNRSYVQLPKLISPKVQEFVEKYASLCNPSQIHVCDGSQSEYELLLNGLIKSGTVQKLNQELYPGCYIGWTDPADVARAEKDTFICSRLQRDSGPTNNWVHPEKMKDQLETLFKGCMTGRTMYVVPFSMGPIGSAMSKIGIQLTDSAYVAANMRIMTRMGDKVLKQLGAVGEFVPCVHSVGQPIKEDNKGTQDYISARSFWPCNIGQRKVTHFPETREIISFGSGYGGNSLLGKKCFALRIASVQARDEGWLAEHMLILGITNPKGEKKYICAAFPSACGKTNLAMMLPTLPGWKVETVGDDIAWMKVRNGRLYAINPEFGFFGVAPGTSNATNPNAMKTMAKNSLFTNVGLTKEGGVYWEGMTDDVPEIELDWKRRQNWQPTLRPNYKGKGTGYKGMGYKVDEKEDPCAQPNSRFTAPIENCPVLDSNWNDPNGVPVDAIIFGGRRDDTLPLVFEAFNWQHGTFVGSAMRSQATAAADQKGLVNDPMAMKPFIGYNVKDYFAHWLSVGNHHDRQMPKIFHVNWFRKDNKGRFLWPGFGDNIRVLEWIFNRCDNRVSAEETAIGYVPALSSLNTNGLNVSQEDMKNLLNVDHKAWLKEAEDIKNYYDNKLSCDNVESEPDVPKELRQELSNLFDRLRK